MEDELLKVEELAEALYLRRFLCPQDRKTYLSTEIHLHYRMMRKKRSTERWILDRNALIAHLVKT